MPRIASRNMNSARRMYIRRIYTTQQSHLRRCLIVVGKTFPVGRSSQVSNQRRGICHGLTIHRRQGPHSASGPSWRCQPGNKRHHLLSDLLSRDQPPLDDNAREKCPGGRDTWPGRDLVLAGAPRARFPLDQSDSGTPARACQLARSAPEASRCPEFRQSATRARLWVPAEVPMAIRFRTSAAYRR